MWLQACSVRGPSALAASVTFQSHCSSVSRASFAWKRRVCSSNVGRGSSAVTRDGSRNRSRASSCTAPSPAARIAPASTVCASCRRVGRAVDADRELGGVDRPHELPQHPLDRNNCSDSRARSSLASRQASTTKRRLRSLMRKTGPISRYFLWGNRRDHEPCRDYARSEGTQTSPAGATAREPTERAAGSVKRQRNFPRW